MATQSYSWETQFDTARNLMFHKFSDRVEICSNLTTGIIRCFRDRKMVAEYDGKAITIKECETLLLNIEKEAQNLPEINPN